MRTSVDQGWDEYKAESARLENEQERQAFELKEADHARGISLRDRLRYAGKSWSQVMEDNEYFDGETEIAAEAHRVWALINRRSA